jgi:ABC-type proline/glycine betaine transport system permease subunit
MDFISILLGVLIGIIIGVVLGMFIRRNQNARIQHIVEEINNCLYYKSRE